MERGRRRIPRRLSCHDTIGESRHAASGRRGRASDVHQDDVRTERTPGRSRRGRSLLADGFDVLFGVEVTGEAARTSAWSSTADAVVARPQHARTDQRLRRAAASMPRRRVGACRPVSPWVPAAPFRPSAVVGDLLRHDERRNERQASACARSHVLTCSARASCTVRYAERSTPVDGSALTLDAERDGNPPVRTARMIETAEARLWRGSARPYHRRVAWLDHRTARLSASWPIFSTASSASRSWL